MSSEEQDYFKEVAGSWLVTNALGGVIVAPLLFALINLFSTYLLTSSLPKTILSAVLCSTVAISMALAQWLVTRNLFKSKLLIPATTISFAIVFFFSIQLL